MNNVENFQQNAAHQSEAAMASAADIGKHLQAIVTAHGDYAKKSFQEGSAFVEKLTSVKSLDKVMEVRAEYAKTAYETFVVESKKIAELYANLVKQAFTPLEQAVAKMTPPAAH